MMAAAAVAAVHAVSTLFEEQQAASDGFQAVVAESGGIEGVSLLLLQQEQARIESMRELTGRMPALIETAEAVVRDETLQMHAIPSGTSTTNIIDAAVSVHPTRAPVVGTPQLCVSCEVRPAELDLDPYATCAHGCATTCACSATGAFPMCRLCWSTQAEGAFKVAIRDSVCTPFGTCKPCAIQCPVCFAQTTCLFRVGPAADRILAVHRVVPPPAPPPMNNVAYSLHTAASAPVFGGVLPNDFSSHLPLSDDDSDSLAAFWRTTTVGGDAGDHTPEFDLLRSDIDNYDATAFEQQQQQQQQHDTASVPVHTATPDLHTAVLHASGVGVTTTLADVAATEQARRLGETAMTSLDVLERTLAALTQHNAAQVASVDKAVAALADAIRATGPTRGGKKRSASTHFRQVPPTPTATRIRQPSASTATKAQSSRPKNNATPTATPRSVSATKHCGICHQPGHNRLSCAKRQKQTSAV